VLAERPTERPADTGASTSASNEATPVPARNKNSLRLLSCSGSADCVEEPTSERDRDRPVDQRKNEGLDYVVLPAPSIGQNHITCLSLPFSPRTRSRAPRERSMITVATWKSRAIGLKEGCEAGKDRSSYADG